MKENALHMCMLFDFYGAILSERQQEMFDLYYNDDLSLSEVAEHVNISRQGVRDAIMKSTDILNEMEEKLHLVGKFHQAERDFQTIRNTVQGLLALNQAQFHSADLQKGLEDISALAAQNM